MTAGANIPIPHWRGDDKRRTSLLDLGRGSAPGPLFALLSERCCHTPHRPSREDGGRHPEGRGSDSIAPSAAWLRRSPARKGGVATSFRTAKRRKDSAGSALAPTQKRIGGAV